MIPRISTVLLLALGAQLTLSVACSSKAKTESTSSAQEEEDDEDTKSKKKKKKKKDKAGKDKDSPPVDKSAKVAVPPYKTEEKKAVELGGKKLTATLCAFDERGSAMVSDSFSKALRGLAIGPDGAIFISDHEGKIRKYRNRSEAGCELVLDTTFGKDGIFTFAQGEADERVAVDSAGTVYAGTGMGPKQIKDGKESDVCGGSGRIAAGPESDKVYVGGKLVKGGECKEALELKGEKDDPFKDILSVYKDGLTVKETQKVKDSHEGRASLFDFDGNRKVMVGKDDGDEDIYFTHDVLRCPPGLCVVDGNASRLRVWGLDGKFVGAVELDRLLGVDIMPQHGDYADGSLWVGGAADGLKDEDLGVIARITGI